MLPSPAGRERPWAWRWTQVLWTVHPPLSNLYQEHAKSRTCNASFVVEIVELQLVVRRDSSRQRVGPMACDPCGCRCGNSIPSRKSVNLSHAQVKARSSFSI